MKQFYFFFRGKKISLPVEECKTLFQKGTGLMFRKDNQALLFVFRKKTRAAIHSFFCQPFIAVWFYNDKIVDMKKINSWQFFIRPKRKFNKLLEIPLTNQKNIFLNPQSF